MGAVDLSEFDEIAPDRLKECSFGRHIKELDKKDQVNLQAALDTDRYSATVILTWLQKHGISVNVDTIRAHRKHACRCYGS